MTRFERLVRIHQRLRQARHPVPMRAFVDELEVARTTITRDFAYLRDILGAPLVYSAEANGHHYDPDAPTFELPGLWLNQSELYALLAMEQLLESMQPGLLAPHIGPLKSRVRRLLSEGGHDAETVSRRIAVLTAGQRETDSDIFSTVAEATLTGQCLFIQYHGRARDARSQRRIHPQRLTNYRNNWYLVAYCEQAEALRLFSLDRIRTAENQDTPAHALDDRAVDRTIASTYGIFSGTATAWAVLRFTPEAARWAAEERWHPDQIGHWTADHYELQVPYSDPTELVMEILRYGPDVEAIAPDEIRDTVARRLREAAGKY
ncbi:helix-turn-helix transcriptional regulator [Aquisalimonas asiatica]|uniref:Predicted DNA-binding transcriptional regulator YafY, contains an HTH and WYL domains n=1 Tax=Aquisalimonas asiatica TaxID=406100 RepID=A0A1H8TAL4_9GAMM|nr:WYL domain-containing protein [Aquisalimonas asiatica]SEO87911.1 Predicted DNA-binding transcriptional regulator YafY, contains an HTH and WYL domains [Aquisalimonas asiatica]